MITEYNSTNLLPQWFEAISPEYFIFQEEEKYLSYIIENAINKNHIAQYIFSKYHEINQNDIESLKWCKKSAKKGYKFAQNHIGIRYQTGKGISKNEEAGFKWFRKAAEQELPCAQYNLANCYQHGIGVAQNTEMASHWFQKAVNNGFKFSSI